MKRTQIFGLVLCGALLLSTVIGCSCKKTDSPETTATTTSVITASEDTGNTDANGYIKDKLPDNLNFNGKTVKILGIYERKIASDTESDLAKSVSNRITSVNKRLSVNIVTELVADSFSFRNQIIEKIENSDKSGSESYDILIQEAGTTGACAIRGLLYNLVSAEYLNLSAPWWPGNQTQVSAVNGKLFAISGDATISATQDAFCIYANSSLAESVGCNDLYKLVNDKDWTTETFFKLMTETKLPENTDGSSRFYLSYDNDTAFDAVFYGAGFTYYENTDEKTAISAKLAGDELSSFYKKYSDLLSAFKSAKYSMSSTYGFTNTGSMFHVGYVSDAEIYLSGVSFDVALMPLPLLDKDQAEYRTATAVKTSMFAITNSCADKPGASAILEAMASYGFRTDRPAYFKTIFKGDCLNTSNNAKVFDLLHTTLYFDSARLFSENSDISSSFRKVSARYNNWKDIYNGGISNWEKDFSKIN